MGSFIEMNDTLQISKEQGFPSELDYVQHTKNQFKSSDFAGCIFEFRNKPKVRIYQLPPVRNFLVQNIDGKWLYWGLIHVLEVTHDTVKQTTSGKFKIVHIYSPEEMKEAHKIVDRNPDTDYLNVM